MKLAAAEVEQLVREVLSTSVWQTQGGKADFDALVRAVLERAAARNSTGAPGELVVAAHVVTLAELVGKLDGIHEIIVPPRAVITPAARDALRERGIAIGYRLPDRKPQPAGPTLVVAEAEAAFDAAKLIDGLTIGGIERLARTGLAQVVEEMSDEVAKGGKLGLLLTGKPAVAVCLANRRRGLRAVAATSPRAAARDVRALGANVLVVDPAERSLFELRQIVRQFVAGAPYPCPMESLR